MEALTTGRGLVAIVLLLAGILAWQGFGNPPVGMANNGDYAKIIGPYWLGSPTELEYRHAPVCYQFSPEHKQWTGYLSAQQLLVAIPIEIGRRIFPPECYDVRLTFAFQAVLFLGCVWLLLAAFARQNIWETALLGLAVAFLLGDAFFASHLASFYSDLAAILGLLLLVALAARSGFQLGNWKHSAALAVAVALLVGSKAQHALCAVPIALWLALAPVGSWRQRAAAIGAVTAAFAFMAAKATPPGYQQIGLYSTIFYEILPNAENPKAELARFADFGVRPEEDAKYIGTYAYQEISGIQNPEFKARFEPRATYPKLGLYYLSRPSAAWRLIQKAMGEAGRQRALLGNFPKEAGLPSSALSHKFSAWSDWKSGVFSEKGLEYVVFCSVIFGAAILLAWLTDRSKTGVAAILATIGAIECCLASLADVLETTRHFAVFNATVDYTLLLLTALALGWAGRKISSRPRHVP
jgi:hypothetical protein